MKSKKLLAVLSALVVAFAAFAFAACSGNTVKGAKLVESGEKLIVIEATETGGSLEDALKLFKDAGKLSYEGREGDYGYYITSVNGYSADDSKNEYWAVYTTLGSYEGVDYSSTDYDSYEYGGKKLGSASYGISGLPLIEGHIYVITLATY